MNAARCFSLLPAATLRRPRGFTLVEILTAMFVLMIGIIGILSVIMRSSQMGTAASDRNNVSVLLSEAIADIERMHLINSNVISNMTTPPTDDPTGELIDTIEMKESGPIGGRNPFELVPLSRAPGANGNTFGDLAYLPIVPAWDSTKTYNIGDAVTYGGKWYSPRTQVQGAIPTDVNSWTWVPRNLLYWPPNVTYSRVMGQFPQAGGDQLLNNNGSAYRALYKLEPHPDWVPDPMDRSTNRENLDSAFVGVYELTITMYRDLDPGKPTTDGTKKLLQIGDPVVVYLRDKKVRN